MDNQLKKYEIAKQALVDASTFDEVKNIRDNMVAMQMYAKQAQDYELENNAAKIRLRAERKIGQKLAEMPKAKGAEGNSSNQHKQEVRCNDVTAPPTLSEIGITKRQSSDWQNIAAIEEGVFESALSENKKLNTENMAAIAKDRKALEKRKIRIKNIEDISQGNESFPDMRYPLIYCDPPWKYEHSISDSRQIENQYPTMTLDEICKMDISSIASDSCILFMWATSPKLKEAMSVLDAWGFSYRTCAVWDKQMIGMGYYFRQQHEILLVATRGDMPPPLPANRVSSVYSEKRGKHSAKPEKFYEIIEFMYPELSKIELFCRQERKGWSVWGNQSE